jgi:hypothetical protein
MATVPYVTRQAVREEAGFQHVEENGSLTGVINGTNKVFMTEHKPIVDRDHSNTTNTEDVTVYVDGAPADVEILDDVAGVITLDTAPGEDVQLMTILYHHSQLSDAYVDQKISEATSIVHKALRANGIAYPFDTEVDAQALYYPAIQYIVVLYAAGMALVRDYGSSADTEETSKDGYKKLATAKSELMKLIEDLVKDDLIPNSGTDGSGGTVEVTNQGVIFPNLSGNLVDGERQGFGGRAADPHEAFFRKG